MLRLTCLMPPCTFAETITGQEDERRKVQKVVCPGIHTSCREIRVRRCRGLQDVQKGLSGNPDKHYTGIDITPKMIEVAKAKQLPGVSFICGDCRNLPFGENSFDIIICSQSFHHYPEPQDFFFSVVRTLRPGGKLILRDITLPPVLMWLANHIEIPILNLLGYGDVKCYGKKEISSFCEAAGLTLESFERRHFMKLHAVIRKG